MNFRLELQVKPFEQQLNIRDNVLLAGSCFTDHMSARLKEGGFHVLENPNGILFNPLSIASAVNDWAEGRRFEIDDLFFHHELWQSWNHHGCFAGVQPDSVLTALNASTCQAHLFLKEARWLIVTLGSAFLYQLNSQEFGQKDMVVANCHKVPAQHFNHRLATLDEVEEALNSIVITTRKINPRCNIIFTISPVRHYREGLVENNRSKGLLHNAVHTIINKYELCSYFPAYELVVDDLRDYRFYAEDLVHPNYAATQYVWEKFSAACIDEESAGIMEKIFELQRAFRHKPFNPTTMAHQQFLRTSLEKTRQLQSNYAFLDLQQLEDYFASSLLSAL